MSEQLRPGDTRSAQTEDGKQIVYITGVDGGIRIHCPFYGIDYRMSGPCYSEEPVIHSVKTSITSILRKADQARVSSQTREYPKPLETQDGDLIAYIHIGQDSTVADCLAIGYSFPSNQKYDADFERAFELGVKSHAEHILEQASAGLSDHSRETFEFARRIANSNGRLPLAFVQNFDVSGDPHLKFHINL